MEKCTANVRFRGQSGLGTVACSMSTRPKDMAKRKRASIAGMLGEAVSDVANAASVAATGSELGVLELAAEDEFKLTRAKRKRKPKRTSKKKVAARNPRKSIWPAPGSEDTELGVLMEREVRHGAAEVYAGVQA